MGRKKQVSAAQAVLLSVADVAVHLGVCRQTVYNFIYHEGLPTIKLRTVRRIDPESLRLWLKERERQLV